MVNELFYRVCLHAAHVYIIHVHYVNFAKVGFANLARNRDILCPDRVQVRTQDTITNIVTGLTVFGRVGQSKISVVICVPHNEVNKNIS